MATRYSDSPLRRVHRPKAGGCETYRECLRLDFDFTCVYCLSREGEVGPVDRFGGFEIEHFRPRGRPEFAHLSDTYDNLLWACHACNRAKGSRWPSKKDKKAGDEFLDPSRVSLAKHLVVDGVLVRERDGSAAGRFTIRKVNLNSETHRHRRRKRREDLAKAQLLRALIEATPERSADEAARLGRALDDVVQEHMLDDPPWDAPASCRCSADPAPGRIRRY